MIEWIDINLLNFPNQPIPMVWIGYNFWNVCKVQNVLLAVWSLELSETIQEIFPLEIQLFCVSLHFQILFGEERRNLANVVSVILTLQWNGEWESLQSYFVVIFLFCLCDCHFTFCQRRLDHRHSLGGAGFARHRPSLVSASVGFGRDRDSGQPTLSARTEAIKQPQQTIPRKWWQNSWKMWVRQERF